MSERRLRPSGHRLQHLVIMTERAIRGSGHLKFKESRSSLQSTVNHKAQNPNSRNTQRTGMGSFSGIVTIFRNKKAKDTDLWWCGGVIGSISPKFVFNCSCGDLHNVPLSLAARRDGVGIRLFLWQRSGPARPRRVAQHGVQPCLLRRPHPALRRGRLGHHL